MLREENIAIEVKSQGYKCKTYTVNPKGTESVLLFESERRTDATSCPVCGSPVHIYDSGSMTLCNETTGEKIGLVCNFTERQKAILKAGSLLAYTSTQLS